MKNIRLWYQWSLDLVDKLLDRLTSYQLMLYYLCALAGAAIILGFFQNQVPFSWYKIAASVGWLIIVCRGVNILLSKKLNIPKNKESDLITALILALILSPGSSLGDWLLITLAAVVAMSSKYLLVTGRRHIFNPAALGAFIVGDLFHYFPSWWVGTKALTPLIFIGGWLVLRKMKRFMMVAVFIGLYLMILGTRVYLNQSAADAVHNLWLVIIASPLLFFAYVMLIEPITTPHRLQNYLPYAVLVAFLYGITSLHISPEEALLIGNVFAFMLEPNRRLKLSFVRQETEAKDIYSLVFSGKSGLKFKAGQYLEWTLPQSGADARGNRRYFTISSSPTEKDLMFTVKVPQPASSFKTKLGHFRPGDHILANSLSGSFVLPKSEKQKLAFFAGGVGITPFRSMVKYLIDFEQARPITLLYNANSPAEFAFKELFKKAEPLGVKTFYNLTGPELPDGWHGLASKIDRDLIEQVVPHWQQTTFYVSGPYGFVTSVRTALLKMGLGPRQIISDYFPGYG